MNLKILIYILIFDMVLRWLKIMMDDFVKQSGRNRFSRGTFLTIIDRWTFTWEIEMKKVFLDSY